MNGRYKNRDVGDQSTDKRPLTPLPWVLIALAMFTTYGAAASQAHWKGAFYVSPFGSDQASGLSSEAPFQTIAKARAAVRSLGDNWKDDVTVYLMPGRYYIDETLLFSEDEGGKNGKNLIFRNHGSLASAVLYGGRPVKRNEWKEGGNGIYTQRIKGVKDIHSLYEGAKRARKARLPNYQHLEEFPATDGAYFKAKQVSEEKPHFLMPRESDISEELLKKLDDDLDTMNLYLVVWGYGRCDWHKWIFPIDKIKSNTGQIMIDHERPNLHKGSSKKDNRYYLEGALRFLDADGEFFYDRKRSLLHYKPYGNPRASHIVFSTANNIIRVEGARNIVLEGLAFTCSAVDADFPGGYTWNDPSAAASLVDATGVTIRDCYFYNTGQSAINMRSSSENKVIGCTMSNLGQSGIKLEYSDRNEIRDCLIHDLGLRRVYCEGVALHSSRDNTIRHLEIYNSARYGITLRARVDAETGKSGRPTTGNVVEYIKMHNLNQDSGDTAGLHMAMLNFPDGPMYTNTFNQITIHRSIAQPDITDEWKPSGVYMDWPKSAMYQSFNNIEVTDYDPRYPGYVPERFKGKYGPDARTSDRERQVYQHRHHNMSSSTKFNCSWTPEFDKMYMEYERIGLTSEFPMEYRNK